MTEISDDGKTFNGCGDDAAADQQSHRSRVRRITIEPAVILYVFYQGCVALLNQQYAYHYLATKEHVVPHHENKTNGSVCIDQGKAENTDVIQHRAAIWFSMISAAGLFPALLALLILGNYSDKISRKDVIWIPLLGGVLKCMCTLLTVSLNLPLQCLLIGEVFENICGGFGVFLMAVFSYIADITTGSNRAWRIIIIEVVIAVGYIISATCSGYLLKFIGYAWSYVVLIAILLIAILYTLIYIRETIQPVHPRESVVSLQAIKNTLSVYQKHSENGRRWRLLSTVLMVFVLVFIQYGRSDIDTLFILGYPFCFTSIELGWFAAVQILICAIVCLLLTRFLQPRIFEMGLVLLGCIFSTAGQVLFGSSVNLGMLILASAVGAPGRVAVAMLRSYGSKLVDQHEYGAMFAGLAWCEVVGYSVGAIIVDQIYQVTVLYYRGLAYFLLAGLYILPIVLSCVMLFKDKKRGEVSTIVTVTQPVVNEDDRDRLI